MQPTTLSHHQLLFVLLPLHTSFTMNQANNSPVNEANEAPVAKHIQSTWAKPASDADGESADERRPATPRPLATTPASSYIETGRTAGRNNGKLHPGYGDSKRLNPEYRYTIGRLRPGFSGPEQGPPVENLQQQDAARHETTIREYAEAEKRMMAAIDQDTADLEKTAAPEVWAEVGPILKRADMEFKAAMQTPPSSATNAQARLEVHTRAYSSRQRT